MLHAISRHVVPRPADWPATATVTGYWFLSDPDPAPLPRALEEFLDAGEPPVFIGFGSMSGADPAATTATVLAAAIDHAVTDARLASSAARLGHQVRAEDGVHEAVRRLETIADRNP